MSDVQPIYLDGSRGRVEDDKHPSTGSNSTMGKLLMPLLTMLLVITGVGVGCEADDGPTVDSGQATDGEETGNPTDTDQNRDTGSVDGDSGEVEKDTAGDIVEDSMAVGDTRDSHDGSPPRDSASGDTSTDASVDTATDTSEPDASADSGQMMPLSVSSRAFSDGGTLPDKYTCVGQGVSPPLSWSGVPASAQSFVVLMADPDAPVGVFKHWAAFDIPAGTTSLSEAIPKMAQTMGFRQGRNDFGMVGYGAACPPPPDGVHRYQFRVWALDVGSLNLSGTPTYAQVRMAAEPHTVAKGMMTGTFSR